MHSYPGTYTCTPHPHAPARSLNVLLHTVLLVNAHPPSLLRRAASFLLHSLRTSPRSLHTLCSSPHVLCVRTLALRTPFHRVATSEPSHSLHASSLATPLGSLHPLMHAHAHAARLHAVCALGTRCTTPALSLPLRSHRPCALTRCSCFRAVLAHPCARLLTPHFSCSNPCLRLCRCTPPASHSSPPRPFRPGRSPVCPPLPLACSDLAVSTSRRCKSFRR
ncbi:hypothetical protein B0H14DRAFT_2678813 [Mycena olivaceomarginata]|nr:hypothetical protein B0H14DRAFT_2678813 [Mycena olivaceomarginata]